MSDIRQVPGEFEALNQGNCTMSGFRHIQRLSRSLRKRGLRETGKRMLRDLLLPRGGRRDRLWAKWGRPVVAAALGRTPPAPPESALTEWTGPRVTAEPPVRTILVIKVDHLGDFFLALPAFAMLRRHFPRARISLLCGSWNQAMARQTGFFDEVHVLDYFINRGDQRLRSRGDPAMVRKLALPAYDLAIDLRVDEDTRGLLDHITARWKVGYESQLMPPDMALILPRPPLRQPDDAPVTMHQRGLDLALVSAVIALLDPLGDTEAALTRITEAEAAEANRLRALWADPSRPGPTIAVNTGSGREIKNWPLEDFIALCRWITAGLGGTVVLLGAPDQAKDATRLAREVGNGVIDQVGQCRMARSLAILRTVDLFLGNDSSLTHAAAAMGIPTVAIFSGIDPIAVWGPLGPHVIALRASVPCSPCSLSTITECTHGHECIRGISIEAVRQAIIRALPPGKARGASTRNTIAEAAE